MPDAASTYAGAVDWLWNFLLIISVFFSVLIMGLLIYFLVKHRQRTRADRGRYGHGVTHSTPLEITWIVVPTVIVIATFVFGFQAFLDMNQPPSNAYEVLAIARQWSWTFQYPDGTTSSELHVPADTPIKLQLQSNDVIHSFFVPAFRVKKDLVPGRYNKAWFEAPWNPDQAKSLDSFMSSPPSGMGESQANVYDLYCAEYCGSGHATMLSRVVVHETQAAFKRWQEAQGVPGEDVKPAAFGKQVFDQYCKSCHMAEGQGQAIGPAWDNAFGAQHQMASGKQITVDENYVRESILYPQREIVAGYTSQNMPSFKGLLNEYQITAVIEYMKSISDNYQGDVLQQFEDTGQE
jgi:cytochrome c oxidase subunit 2